MPLGDTEGPCSDSKTETSLRPWQKLIFRADDVPADYLDAHGGQARFLLSLISALVLGVLNMVFGDLTHMLVF